MYIRLIKVERYLQYRYCITKYFKYIISIRRFRELSFRQVTNVIFR